jgi:hypothetical protein
MYDFGETEPSPEQIQSYKKRTLTNAELANRRYFRRLRWFLIVALVAGSSYLLDKRPESISFENSLLALGITWLGLLPSFQYLLDRNRPPIPFFPLVGIFYATSFGLPMFAGDLELTGKWSLSNVTSTALTLVLLGVAGMNIAFFISKFVLWKKVSKIRISESYSLGKLLTLLWLLLISHIAFIYIPSIQKIPSIGQLLDPVGYIAYGMFYILWSRGKLPAIQIWILLGVFVPLEVLKRFVSGLLAEVMTLGLYMVIVSWSERKRIPIIFISTTLLIYLVFSPVKAEFRTVTWFSNNSSNISILDKAQLFIDLAIKHYQNSTTNSSDKSSEDLAGSLVSRSSIITVFSEVVKDTPSRVPYWNGETYLPLFTSYIPRIVWPDKPVLTTGNAFGRRYNYLRKTDFETSFNLPWIVEMYANFGSLGVLIGMPLAGVLLAFLEQKFNYPGMNSVELVFGATLLFRLFYQESSFALMLGAIVNLSLALYVLFKVFLGGKKRRRSV